MDFNVTSGNIQANVLYIVIGAQSVTYNSITYTTGQTFRGINGITTYTLSGGIGSVELDEVLELFGNRISFKENSIDQPVNTDITMLNGFSIEFDLNDAEKIVNEVTTLKGFGIELLDYPFYAFEITETRL